MNKLWTLWPEYNKMIFKVCGRMNTQKMCMIGFITSDPDKFSGIQAWATLNSV